MRNIYHLFDVFIAWWSQFHCWHSSNEYDGSIGHCEMVFAKWTAQWKLSKCCQDTDMERTRDMHKYARAPLYSHKYLSCNFILCHHHHHHHHVVLCSLAKNGNISHELCAPETFLDVDFNFMHWVNVAFVIVLALVSSVLCAVLLVTHFAHLSSVVIRPVA